MALNEALLSSKSHDWRTPPELFEAINSTYQFTLDAAADTENALCPLYFTEEDDALAQSWNGHRVWCNPPYGRELAKFVKKAFSEWVDNATTTVLLIPARPDTKVWQDIILPHASVSFLAGRLKFLRPDGTSTDPAPFPSAVVVFEGWKATMFHQKIQPRRKS